MTDIPNRSRSYVLLLCALGLIAVLGLIAFIVNATSGSTQVKLIEKLLDWPVLGFITLLIIFAALGNQLTTLLGNSNIKIAGLIEIENQMANVESTTDETIAKLNDRVTALEAALNASEGLKLAAAPITTSDPNLADDAEIYQSLLHSLGASNYRWRSLERLGYEVGVADPDKVATILRRYGKDEVRMGKGKSGRPIARLI